MNTILCENSRRLPKQVQLQRIRQVVLQELTPLQRETLMDYHIHGKSIP